ncbi:hypothetical protein BVRB_4g087010 [Beta vulgaris subsp. vulgaris]|uniref:Uncharacterized protein n=1 Tax=Beta vulgaris subsp. vulgaris TaxID=3555 RepID=A0A0J8CHN9_BETVV|nr:hypothetical protein BVRB_4g087010 [Beta vulgaris subsp. vulgaris]
MVSSSLALERSCLTSLLLLSLLLSSGCGWYCGI